MAGFSNLYGFRILDIEHIRALIESALQINLAAHESIYRGGDYYRLDQEDFEIILQRNFDCIDDDLAESEFPDSLVLLYLTGKERAEDVARQLSAVAEATLLRHVSYR